MERQELMLTETNKTSRAKYRHYMDVKSKLNLEELDKHLTLAWIVETCVLKALASLACR